MKLCMYGNDDIFFASNPHLNPHVKIRTLHRNDWLIHNEILISFNNRNLLIVKLYFLLIFLQE